jgi:GTP-binding protein
MNIKNAKYELTAVRPDQYPAHHLPEIALVGRSNVGKSSIINTLLNKKNLARVAAEPGRTRQINFYNIDDALYFADLPGYGYARVSKAEKDSWAEMIETYLNSRNQLKLIIMLVDIRHAPSDDDQTMFDWLISQDRARLVVATKLDKITRSQIFQRLQDIRSTLAMNEGETLIPFSAVTGQGRDEIWNQIRRIIGHDLK